MNKIIDSGVNIDKNKAKEITDFFQDINKIFGIIDFSKTKKQIVSNEIKILLQEREIARKNKDWQKSDELRNKITEMGYTIEDTSSGQVIKKI